MAEQIDHSVFVYRGDFHVPEAAALAAVQKSKILLRENNPEEALIAAKKGCRLAAGESAGADGLGRRPDGLGAT